MPTPEKIWKSKKMKNLKIWKLWNPRNMKILKIWKSKKKTPLRFACVLGGTQPKRNGGVSLGWVLGEPNPNSTPGIEFWANRYPRRTPPPGVKSLFFAIYEPKVQSLGKSKKWKIWKSENSEIQETWNFWKSEKSKKKWTTYVSSTFRLRFSQNVSGQAKRSRNVTKTQGGWVWVESWESPTQTQPQGLSFGQTDTPDAPLPLALYKLSFHSSTHCYGNLWEAYLSLNVCSACNPGRPIVWRRQLFWTPSSDCKLPFSRPQRTIFVWSI